MSEPRPNIIFIFSDQQRWDTCGCYGQALPITPNLDRLASEGVLFENAFTCQPVCGPARAVLQTGKYCTEVNCPTNHCMLPLDEPTIAKTLRDAGYETAYIGKWHLASYGPRGGADDFRDRPVPTERRGGYRDHWLASDVLEFTSHSYDGHMFDGDGLRHDFPEGRYRVDAQTDWVLEFLESRTGDKPFFLFDSYIEPHHQNDHNCYEGPHGSKERWADYEIPGDLRETQGDWRENYPDYLGCCHSLDENVGRIVAKLEELGMADNTVILYTSDHGSHFRTRNGEYKRSCHDGCLHVPLILWGPGFTGGQRVTELVSLIDLPPTVLSAAVMTPPATMQGRPVQALLDDTPPIDWRDDVFVQISESQCGRAVRTAKWTYSMCAPDGRRRCLHSDVYYDDYLYDNEEDPHQRTNLAADPAYEPIRAEMRQRVFRNMVAAGEPVPMILPASENPRLQGES